MTTKEEIDSRREQYLGIIHNLKEPFFSDIKERITKNYNISDKTIYRDLNSLIESEKIKKAKKRYYLNHNNPIVIKSLIRKFQKSFCTPKHPKHIKSLYNTFKKKINHNLESKADLESKAEKKMFNLFSKELLEGRAKGISRFSPEKILDYQILAIKKAKIFHYIEEQFNDKTGLEIKFSDFYKRKYPQLDLKKIKKSIKNSRKRDCENYLLDQIIMRELKKIDSELIKKLKIEIMELIETKLGDNIGFFDYKDILRVLFKNSQSLGSFNFNKELILSGDLDELFKGFDIEEYYIKNEYHESDAKELISFKEKTEESETDRYEDIDMIFNNSQIDGSMVESFVKCFCEDFLSGYRLTSYECQRKKIICRKHIIGDKIGDKIGKLVEGKGDIEELKQRLKKNMEKWNRLVELQEDLESKYRPDCLAKYFPLHKKS